MKISIIVPVYDVEPYIYRCLRSLIEQDLPKNEYEIIVVNDGSPDNSREVVIKIQKDINNIVLIDQDNQGVSIARNTGLDAAKGEFVLFIDPDDYVKKHTLDSLYRKALNNKLDVLYLGFEFWGINGDYSEKADYAHLENNIFTGTIAYRATRGQKMPSPDHSVAILFSRSFLLSNALRYKENIPFLEDGHFVGKVLCIAKRCAFSNKPFYVCKKRPGSASTTKKKNDLKKINGLLIAAKDLQHFSQNQNYSVDQIKLINHLIAKFVITSIMNAISSRNTKTLKYVRKELVENNLGKLKTSGLTDLKPYANWYNMSYWSFVCWFSSKIIHNKLQTCLKRKSS